MKAAVLDPDTKDWRRFEALSLRLIESAFRMRPKAVLFTRQSKDGGFDGGLRHDLAAEDAPFGPLDDLTLIEAKMRGAKSGIGLRDFAATMVIAHNECANTLLVVANRRFTPQALQEVSRFFFRTNMRVKLVDGPTVSGWVRRNFESLRDHFPELFLRSLIMEDANKEAASSSVVPCVKKPLVFQGPVTQRSKALTLETGWREDDSMASCDLTAEDGEDSSPDADPPTLIGEARVDTLRRLVSTVQRADEAGAGAICLLAGTGGVGKSVLVSHLVARLTDTPEALGRRWVAVIDVGRQPSSRALFIAILTALLGADPYDLTADQGDAWRPEALVAHLAGTPADNPICKAVLRAITEDRSDFESSWDLNVEPLLAFLDRLVSRRSRRQPMTLIVHELNTATEETLDFLFQACRVLRGAGASVVVEMRTAGYERSATVRDRDGSNTVMSPEQWDVMVRRFESLCDGGRFDVEPPQRNDAIDYVRSLLPGLGDRQAGVIVDHVGRVPLHLKLTADWHRAEGILVSREGSPFLVEDLERFFADQNITPDSVNTIFDRLIDAWAARSDRIYRSAMIAAPLLRGELSLATLRVLDETKDAEDVADKLIGSGLFRVSDESSEAIEVAHALVLERMEVRQQRSLMAVASVAQVLHKRLDTVCPDPRKRARHDADLLLAMGPPHALEASQRAHAVGNDLAQTRDWSEAARYFERGHDSLGSYRAKPHEDPNVRILRIRILADWLDVEILRYRIGTPANRNRVSALLNGLVFDPDLPLESHDRTTLELRAAVIEWRHYFVNEMFEEAERAASRGRTLALNCPDGVDVETRGKALANHAVTLKVRDRKDESIKAFNESLDLLPQSCTVRAERLSNLAAFYLRDDPGCSLEYYKEILAITRNSAYSFSEIIHTHVDVAMANFLLGDLDAAANDAQRAIKLAMDNSVAAEEARARNILGCVHWCRDVVEAAHGQFLEAAFASERSISHRFLWRMRTNAAGTALALGRTDECFGLARSAEDAIVHPREADFRRAQQDHSHMTSRWYAALIAIAACYAKMDRPDDLDRLYARVKLPRFRDHARQFIEGAPPQEVFGETTHLRGQTIMITG